MPSAPCALLRLTPREHARFRRIRLASLEDSPGAFGSTYAETAQRPPDVWRRQLEDLPTWVAERAGRDVGVVRCHIGAHEAELLSLWVAPEARGQGVGDALVREVLAHAAAIDCPAVTLSVRATNRPAIRLYARLGFTEDPGPADEDGEARWTFRPSP